MNPLFTGEIAISKRLLNTILHRLSHFFKLSVPVAAQIESIHIGIRIPPTLQRAIIPILNVDIYFLVQITNDGRGNFADT